MELLYISCYPDEYFDKLQSECIYSSSQPAQKFNYLLMKGFALNNEAITIFNTMDQKAINETNFHHSFYTSLEKNIKFIFLPVYKNNTINRIQAKKNIKYFLSNWEKKYPNTVIIVDVLKPYVEYIFEYSGKMPIVSIVTDLPEHLYMSKNLWTYFRRKLKLYFFNYIIHKSNAFVFLTEQMNKKLNISNKPYLIIEGVVDSEYALQFFKEDDTRDKFICLYSGALHARYGIEKLVNAFTLSGMENIELHLYGSGDYVNVIKQIANMHDNIIYHGIIDTKSVVKKQQSASLLINPRPVNIEFTAYSFPSKNMEYMLSGVPVLTTDLSGMPPEYKSYVYILDATSSESIANSVKKIINIPNSERKLMGERAQKFVLQNKNNVIQAERIVKMIKEKLKQQ